MYTNVEPKSRRSTGFSTSSSRLTDLDHELLKLATPTGRRASSAAVGGECIPARPHLPDRGQDYSNQRLLCRQQERYLGGPRLLPPWTDSQPGQVGAIPETARDFGLDAGEQDGWSIRIG